MTVVETAPSVRERYAGLVYAALAADSLALGAHWIYDEEEIAARHGRVTEFLPPAEDGYHPGKDTGAQTHYGDQTLLLLDSLETCGGNFVMDDFADRWRSFWDGARTYRDKATKQTLAQLQAGVGLTRAGSQSHDLGGAVRIAPVLASLRQEDQPTIIAAARAQTALTHAAPLVLDVAEFLARTVFLLMRDVTVPSALQMAATLPYRALPAEEYLRHAHEVKHLPVIEAVKELGQACPVEQSLPSVFAILLHDGDDLQRALEENVMAGGDSAARGMALGIILGAAYGRKAVPERWVESLQARPRIERFLKTVRL